MDNQEFLGTHISFLSDRNQWVLFVMPATLFADSMT